MARMAGSMTVAIGFSAATIDGGDGAAPKVTQLKNLDQDVRTLLFQSGEGVWQRAPPIRTYAYVRIIAPKKESRKAPSIHVAHPSVLRILPEFPRSATLST